jgi:hypothetical protein
LTVEQLGQVIVLGRAAGAADATAAVVPLVAVVVAVGAAVVVVAVVALVVEEGVTAVPVEGTGGTITGVVATAVRRERIITKARAITTRATSTSNRISQGKPPDVEAGVAVPGVTFPGLPASEVEPVPTSPVGTGAGCPLAVVATASGTWTVWTACGGVVAWGSGAKEGAPKLEAEATPTKTMSATERPKSTATMPRRLRPLDLDVECINEKIEPPKLFEPRHAQARRLLYQLRAELPNVSNE